MKGFIQNKQIGFSLIEILMGMVIGIFLVTGVMQVYLGNRASYRFTESNSDLQASSRFAFETMSSDIRLSRFLGCLPYEGDNSNVVNHLNTASGNYDVALHDFIDEPSVTFEENLGLNGSDSITIHTAYPTLSTIKLPYNVDKDHAIQITKNKLIKGGDIILLSNCSGGDIFEASSIGAGANAGQSAIKHTLTANSGTPGNKNGTLCSAGSPAHCLSQTYGADSALFVLQAVKYEIKDNGDGQPTLWRSVNEEEEELVVGVEEMQLLVGIDSDGDGGPNQYITSDNVVDESQIVSIRIMLLMKSNIENTISSPQEYTYNGNDITAPDLNLRRPFTLTVALRNL